MANLNLKHKVPKDYSYPLTIKDTKELAQSHKEIEDILYVGISHHDQIKKSKSIWLGELIASNENGNWQYKLRIYASRNCLFENQFTIAKKLMIDEIEDWLMWNSKSLAIPITFNRLYLSAKIENDELVSTSSEHTNSGFINKK